MITKFKIFETIIPPVENRLSLNFSIEDFRSELQQNIENVTQNYVFGGVRNSENRIGIITLLQQKYITARECVNYMVNNSTDIMNSNDDADDIDWPVKLAEGVISKEIPLNLSDVHRIISTFKVWPSLVVKLSDLKYPKIWLKEYVEECESESEYGISEVGWYKLYKNEIITKQQFVSKFNDLYIREDKIVFIVEDLNDIDFLIKSNQRENVMNHINGEEQYFDMEYSLDDIDWVWNYIKLETKKQIVDMMVGVEFDHEDIEEKEVFKKEKVIEKNKDLYYKFDDGLELKISDIIEYCKNNEFEFIWEKLDRGYSDANESDYNTQVYKFYLNGFKEPLGHFEEVLLKEYIDTDGQNVKKYAYMFYSVDLTLLTELDYDESFEGVYFPTWIDVLKEASNKYLIDEISYSDRDFSPNPSKELLNDCIKYSLD